MKHSTRKEGEIVVIAFEGDMDLQHSSEARQALLTQVTASGGLVVDLSAVHLIDSSGVASLLEAFQEAHKAGKTFVLAAATDPVIQVLALARLDEVFVMADSVDAALEG